MEKKSKKVKEKKLKEEKKETEKKVTKKKPKKKRSKAFTLIELLAVIIILGILMIIAIPSVTTYISNSRKSAYVDTVKEIVGGARTLVNSGKLDTYDRNVTYYIPTSCINAENGLQSPYGKFSTAYVIVTYTGEGYNYYFTGNDVAKMGIKTAVPYDLLKEENVEADVEDTDIKLDVGIDGRNQIEIFNEDCNNKQTGLIPNTYVDNEGNEVPIGEIPGHQYYNASLEMYYGSLQAALNEASSGNTIKVMGYVEENETINIPSGLSRLKLDFNGYTIHFDWRIEWPIINDGELILINTAETEDYNQPFNFDMWSPMLNNGTIEVNDNVEFRSENEAIENHGIVYVKGGHVFGYDADGIENYGIVNVSGGEVNGYSVGIRNHNIVTISGGEVSGYTALTNCETCTTSLSGNGMINGNSTAVGNSGTFIANGGTIKSSYPYSTTGIYNSGNVTLNNVTIETRTSGRGFNTYGIRNQEGGTVTFNSGTLSSSTSSDGGYAYGIENAGTLNINNGTINATTQQYYGLSATGIYIKDNGVVTILNGKINGSYNAIDATGNYTLTIGNNDGNVSTTSPEIYGTSINGIGISLGSNGTFNFYDGVIKYARGVTNCIKGTAATMNYPDGYTLHKQFDNPLGTAYLVMIEE